MITSGAHASERGGCVRGGDAESQTDTPALSASALLL